MRRRFQIAEAMTVISGRAVFGTPKTHQTRSVPIPAFLFARIATHIAGRSPDAFVKGVQAMLGHASATLTLDRYGHLFEDELDPVADRIDVAARKAAKVSRTKRGLAVVKLDPQSA